MNKCLPLLVVVLTSMLASGAVNPSHADGQFQGFTGPRIAFSSLSGKLVVFGSKAQAGRGSAVEAGVFGQPLENGPNVEAEMAATKPKSPKKAFLLSALVPGTGQLYSKAKRGYLFLGIEALAVAGYLVFHHKGNNWKERYEGFADQRWIRGEYQEWYGYWEDQGVNLDSLLTHHLPNEKNHDYYEMIGKYDQFVYGWEDVYDRYRPEEIALAEVGDIPSKHREEYLNMREKSNRYLRWAGYGVGVMLFNRVLSAIDAARAAQGYNERMNTERIRMDIEFRMRSYGREQIPEAVLSAKF